jgi:hypothetical protein
MYTFYCTLLYPHPLYFAFFSKTISLFLIIATFVLWLSSPFIYGDTVWSPHIWTSIFNVTSPNNPGILFYNCHRTLLARLDSILQQLTLYPSSVFIATHQLYIQPINKVKFLTTNLIIQLRNKAYLVKHLSPATASLFFDKYCIKLQTYPLTTRVLLLKTSITNLLKKSGDLKAIPEPQVSQWQSDHIYCLCFTQVLSGRPKQWMWGEGHLTHCLKLWVQNS